MGRTIKVAVRIAPRPQPQSFTTIVTKITELERPPIKAWVRIHKEQK